MSVVVEKEDQLKFNLPVDLRSQMEAMFEAQGVNIKTGLARIIQFVVSLPEELHPIILGQLRGNGAAAVAKAILDQGRSETRASKLGAIFGRQAASTVKEPKGAKLKSDN